VLLPIYSPEVKQEIFDFKDVQWSERAISRSLNEDSINEYRNSQNLNDQYDAQEEWFSKLKNKNTK
jgi:hypothetical protein